MRQALEAGVLARLCDVIYRAGEGKHHELASQILDIAERVDDERTLENASWALGKLSYHPAQALLVRLLLSPGFKVVRAASWALGEVGNDAALEPLRHAYARSKDPQLRQVIGGALKKLAGLPTRAYAGSVEKRLRPPRSVRPQVNGLVIRLEELDFDDDRSEVLRLRRELQQLDPEYLRAYMTYRTQIPSALRALASSQVYFDAQSKWRSALSPR